MKFHDAQTIDRTLDPVALADALADAFRSDVVVPVRHHHGVERPGAEATLLLMPAWTGPATKPAFMGAKIVSVFPTNAAKNLPSVYGTYMLMDGETGAPLAALDGARLTAWRTAAASALAARHLARKDAKVMTMVGAGALAPFLIRAHRAARPIERIMLWNHRPERAKALAAELSAAGLPVEAVADLDAAVAASDLISCATLSHAPLIRGELLAPGTHLDCVGAFRPWMRETDDATVERASIFCDTRAGALSEAGDLAAPIAAGVISAADVKADLFDLTRGVHPGRTSETEITLFKSVGTAIEDLAAAMLVHARAA